MITHMETRPPKLPPRRHRRALLLTFLVIVPLAFVGIWAWSWATQEDAAIIEAQRPEKSPPVWVPPQITQPEIPPDRVVVEAQADGCLGGPDPHTAVLAAQQTAPLTDTGAAEFALAVQRWHLTAPYGPEMAAQITLVFTDPAPWLERLSQPDLAAGGQYRLVRPELFTYDVLANNGTTATVRVSTDRELAPAGDGPVASARLTGEYVLAARDGHWQVQDTRPPSGGEPVSPYFGACA